MNAVKETITRLKDELELWKEKATVKKFWSQ